MNDAVRRLPILSALLIAALVLTAMARLRSAEYDEQYTLFLTGGAARPDWGADAITAGEVQQQQSGHAGLAAMARELRATDVHPPLYFWILALWRLPAGGSLFAARLASVLFSIVTLGLVAAIARSLGIPPGAAVLLTLGCTGFSYTGATARGFALAQMLSVAGVAVLIVARPGVWRAAGAGSLLGAATFANYLAAFVACAALLHSFIARGEAAGQAIRRGTAVLLGFAVWLPADLWFFLAQRQSRAGQFVPFEPIHFLARLGRYAAAAVFGGLPLYVDGGARIAATIALAAVSVGLIVLTVLRWHCLVRPQSARTLLAMAAAAPPVGLLLLGIVFDTTPIELRYLAFATPFVGLLLAAVLPRHARWDVLVLQAVALLGLMTRQETMQPARATAAAVAQLARDGVALVPRGNDGVGIVGAFALESAPTLRLLVIGRQETPEGIRARAANYPRVVLALLGQDDASRATLPVMRRAFADPCWRAAAEAFDAVAFDRICGAGCACPARVSR